MQIWCQHVYRTSFSLEKNVLLLFFSFPTLLFRFHQLSSLLHLFPFLTSFFLPKFLFSFSVLYFKSPDSFCPHQKALRAWNKTKEFLLKSHFGVPVNSTRILPPGFASQQTQNSPNLFHPSRMFWADSYCDNGREGGKRT